MVVSVLVLVVVVVVVLVLVVVVLVLVLAAAVLIFVVVIVVVVVESWYTSRVSGDHTMWAAGWGPCRVHQQMQLCTGMHLRHRFHDFCIGKHGDE